MNTIWDTLLIKHGLWLKTYGKEGTQLIVKDQDMSGLNLSNTNLTDCAFLGVTLDYSDISKAELDYSNLGGSSFKQANLSGISIVKAGADHADFANANINNSNAFRTTFLGANFKSANLTGVNFSGSLLNNANFNNSIISECRFYNASLIGATGLETAIFDWIEIGEDGNSVKLHGYEATQWLLEHIH